jgi:hypothetical protein
MTREEDLLRRALAVEAERVEVEARALGEIRERIATRRARWWHRLRLPWRGTLFAGAAVAFAAGAAAVVALVALAPPRPAPEPVPPASVGVSAAAPGTAGLPLYYLGRGAGHPLYREFRSLPAGGGAAGRVTAAVTAILSGPAPADPDYTSPWPAGARVRAAGVDGGTATVDLAGAGAGPADPVTARQGVQQLIWTATAANTGTTGVRLLLDGRPATTLWGVPASGVLHRGAAVDVLAPVWLIDPQQGAEVGRAFEVRVAGIVFEGTVQVRVRDASGAVVRQRTVQLDRGAPAQGEARLNLTLPSGRYTVEAYFVSQRDGSEQGLDGHAVTVR